MSSLLLSLSMGLLFIDNNSIGNSNGLSVTIDSFNSLSVASNN